MSLQVKISGSDQQGSALPSCSDSQHSTMRGSEDLCRGKIPASTKDSTNTGTVTRAYWKQSAVSTHKVIGYEKDLPDTAEIIDDRTGE